MIALLETTLRLPGDVIECGVFRGGSVQKIARTVMDHAPQKTIYACDSFQGFPQEQVGRIDVGFFRFLSRIRRKFQSCGDTPERLERVFKLFNVRGEVVKGYFDQSLLRFRESQFCFIHLDCDIYESYKTCLGQLYDRLIPGGIVVFDDYGSPKWPGAEKAVNEFFAVAPGKIEQCVLREIPAWYVKKPG